MTQQESYGLSLGDRVVFANEVGGEVIGHDHYTVTIQWNDGETYTLDHREMGQVERAASVPVEDS